MIEIIYKNEDENLLKDENIKLPKNIRQIGESNSDYQVYVEDNIMNYLKKVPVSENDIRYGVLLGSVKKAYGYTYVFVNGAVDVEDIVENTVIFSDEIWTNLNDCIHRYFRNVKVVGWFTSLNYQINNDMPYITKLHLDNFAGNDKLYLKLDRTEDEESFYVYGTNSLVKLPGYHIYYEKNTDMDDYIYGSDIEFRFLKNNGKKEAVKEKAESKKTETPKYGIEENGKKNIIKYEGRAKKITGNIASVLLVLALVGTITIVSNQSAMNSIKSKLMQMIANGKQDENNIPVNGIINEPTELETATVEKNGENETTGGKVITIEQVTTTEKNDETETKTDETKTTEWQTTEGITSGIEVTASAVPNERSYYIVESGDTLYSIAVKLYNDPDKVNDILRLNEISDINYVEEGKKLLLP